MLYLIIYNYGKLLFINIFKVSLAKIVNNEIIIFLFKNNYIHILITCVKKNIKHFYKQY